VNEWFLASLALLVGVVPLGIVLVRGDTVSRLVALEAIGVEGALALVLLAEAFDRSIYASLAVVEAATSIVTGLLFARFMERYE
jgi:multisubunit Na+/H+ antiporter MnhF subunit